MLRDRPAASPLSCVLRTLLPPQRCGVEDAVDGGMADSQRLRDLRRSDPLCTKRRNLIGLCSRSRFPPLVFPISLGPGNPLATKQTALNFKNVVRREFRHFAP